MLCSDMFSLVDINSNLYILFALNCESAFLLAGNHVIEWRCYDLRSALLRFVIINVIHRGPDEQLYPKSSCSHNSVSKEYCSHF